MKSMKKLLVILLLIPLLLSESIGAEVERNLEDTVLIELGSNKKIAIVVDSQEDLKKLEEYDLNKIISDLNTHADTVVFKKEKKKQGKWEKDTTYYFHRKKADIDFSIANYKVEIKSNDFDDLGDDIEDFVDHYKHAEREEKLEEEVEKYKNGFNIDLGMNNWLGGDGLDTDNLHSVKPWGSWYVALKRNHRIATGGRGFINWGYGVSWYNWKFENRNTRIVKGADAISFEQDDAVEGLKSKLTASFINIEVIPMLDYSYGKRKVNTVKHGNVTITRYRKVGFRFGMGPYVGYRMGSKTKIVYKDKGDKRKDKDHDNFYLNNLRYGLRAQVGYNKTDFFINYDLNKVFSKGKGPELNAISFGIVL